MEIKWITIYTTSAFECPWCLKALELLRVYGRDFYIKDINTNENYRKEFLELGHKTIPQCYIKTDRVVQELIGGHDQLQLWLRANHSRKAQYEKDAETFGF